MKFKHISIILVIISIIFVILCFLFTDKDVNDILKIGAFICCPEILAAIGVNIDKFTGGRDDKHN